MLKRVQFLWKPLYIFVVVVICLNDAKVYQFDASLLNISIMYIYKIL